MKKVYFYLSLTISLTISASTLAQDDPAKLEQVIRTDSADINTIASYPENVRNAIFEVAMHPEGIVKIGDLQKKSNEQFKTMIASYSKDEQQKIWNLTRYDGLIRQLSREDAKSKVKAEEVLKKYPAEIHDDALNYALNSRMLLKKIDELNSDFSSSLDQDIIPFPATTQSAFHDLLKTPEVLDILNNNMHMTLLIGDIYRGNSAMVQKRFNELNLELAQQKARELEEWKEQLKNDPDATKELQESAKDFANEKGYHELEYREANPEVVTKYVYVPYPYWCGYPWWFEHEYWYPYPYWYHWGFYFWHGEMVWYNMPSWYFVHWHFDHYPHFYHYPHMTNIYINHYYYGPRRTVSRNTEVVNKFMRNNESSLPRDFRTDNNLRIERIREYGKSEIDRVKYNQSNPDRKISREDYIKQHGDQYPDLRNTETIKQPVTPIIKEKTKEEKPVIREEKPFIKPVIKQETPVKERERTIFKNENVKPVIHPHKIEKSSEFKKPVEQGKHNREVPSKQETNPRREPVKQLNPPQNRNR